MVKVRESEESSNSGFISAPSKEKLLSCVKQQKGKKASPSVLNRCQGLCIPDLLNCHVCSSRVSSKTGKDELQTLDSQWRIVVMCNSCYDSVQSAKFCAYCFMKMSGLGTSCRVCDRRVHQGCMWMYRRQKSWPDSGSFTCIDCWLPKSLKKVGCNGKGNEDGRIRGNTSPSRASGVSLDLRDCSKCLKDVVKDAKSIVVMKLDSAVRAREKALEKAAAARHAAEMAANALDLAVATATKETQIDGNCPDLDDAKLAMRLHLAMNNSPRIFKNTRLTKLDSLVDLKT